MANSYIKGEEKIGDPRFDVRAEDDPNPQDEEIRDRVDSEILGYPDVPKGALNINVEGGIVVIRGQVPSQETIDNIVLLVRSIPGVRDVTSYMHLPGTPAPNKASVLEISS
jgi:osmotically-inducible protein OsmY